MGSTDDIKENPMTAYAMAQLRSVDFGAEIAEYLQRIDETLIPYEGKFLVHGTTPEVIDGDFPGAIVVIAFPDRAHAYDWYNSPGYQAILPFRMNNSDGGALIVDGVPDGYRASSYLAKVGWVDSASPAAGAAT
jgi:uncharacterized protein (DUF1330 family)